MASKMIINFSLQGLAGVRGVTTMRRGHTIISEYMCKSDDQFSVMKCTCTSERKHDIAPEGKASEDVILSVRPSRKRCPEQRIKKPPRPNQNPGRPQTQPNRSPASGTQGADGKQQQRRSRIAMEKNGMRSRRGSNGNPSGARKLQRRDTQRVHS